MVDCPKCDAVIDVDEEDLDEGEPLICEECGAHLVVVGLDPLEIEEESEVDEEDDGDFEEEFEEEGEDEAEEEEEEEDEWR
jgi:alpha-aminoadipate/glutamate carrier protein LysW